MSGSNEMSSQHRALILASHPASLVRFRGDLIRALLDRQVVVHAAAPDLGVETESARLLAEWGVATHEIGLQRTGLNPLWDMRSAIQLYALLRQVQPTYLLAYTAKPVIYGLLAARVAGLRRATALITGLGYAFAHASSSPKRKLVQLLLRRLYRSALKSAWRVVFQNPDDRELFVQLGLARAEQCTVVDGSGVNLEEYCVAPLPPPETPLRFLLIARLIRDKGIGQFVAAGHLLRQTHPQVELHLVGGLDQNPESISRAELQRWVAERSVIYHGHVNDVRPLIRRSHVFVLPSFYREGIPRTILEAMAMGRPVITCDTPGCRETVVDGKNGFLVPPRDVPALAKAMLRFAEEPARLGPMGQAARQLVEQRYDVVKVNRQMLAHMGLEEQAPHGAEPSAREGVVSDL